MNIFSLIMAVVGYLTVAVGAVCYVIARFDGETSIDPLSLLALGVGLVNCSHIERLYHRCKQGAGNA